MSYDFKKSLILAGLIAIGSDGTVLEGELDLFYTMLRKNGITPGEEQKLLKEITPRLGTAIEKGNLFKEVVQNLSMVEKKEILQSCCTLIASDMYLGENEVKTIKTIGSLMNISKSTLRSIIDTEMSRHSG